MATVEWKVRGRFSLRETGRLLGRQLDAAGFAEVAEAWRPWRTWASVAIRASSAR
jgi:3-methyladenine DNA glycosylase/8-oxoguanine DNA glycosylase